VARAAGTRLGVVQHDFIPLRHPELVPPKSTAIFLRWIQATLARADFVLAVSEAVARETRAELLALGRAEIATRHVATFRNGSDFCEKEPPQGARSRVRTSLQRFLAAGSVAPFLTVGTIEPRKNQAYLVEALAAGLPVLASDIPVHREVGGRHCTYFDPHCPDVLAACLRDFCRHGARGRRGVRPDRLPSWTEAAEKIVTTALTLVDRGSTPRVAAARLRLAG
jgi:glycosyltransferase involved in cell wall biosynthesis